jgi:hypothetical protein
MTIERKFNHMKLRIFTIAIAFIGILSCSTKDDIDTDKPLIHTDYISAFPSFCDTIYFGETFNLRAFFSDNAELGAYSIDMHNNFDHHSHGHKIQECDLWPVKQAVNPFVYREDFTIPSGQKEYEAYVPISIPSQNDKGAFDEGDYHFQIYLTDKGGWSTPLGLSVKMLYRKTK